MTIHFTPEGIFADTEEEKLEFYDEMHRGNPVIMAHLEIWRISQSNEEAQNDHRS